MSEYVVLIKEKVKEENYLERFINYNLEITKKY